MDQKQVILVHCISNPSFGALSNAGFCAILHEGAISPQFTLHTAGALVAPVAIVQVVGSFKLLLFFPFF